MTVSPNATAVRLADGGRSDWRPDRGHGLYPEDSAHSNTAEKALAHFEAGKVTTLIATDVAARGLDLSDITHVINFDPPEDEKAYTHRVGRTGRAGRSGTGVTLVLPDQQAEVSRVARLNGQTDKWEETGMKSAAPKLVYSGRKRGSKWGPTRPRRKI